MTNILNRVNLSFPGLFFLRFIECEDLEGDRVFYVNYLDIEALCPSNRWKEHYSFRALIGNGQYTTLNEFKKILIAESCQSKSPVVLALFMALMGEASIDDLLRLAIKKPEKLDYFYGAIGLYLDWISEKC